MRIIKIGKITLGFEGIWDCTSCGARWELDERDKGIPRLSQDQRDGDSWAMACPTCKKEVWCAKPTQDYTIP